MPEILNATKVRNQFSEFIDSVVREKPRVVKRNRDIFWSISNEITSELLSSFTLTLEYETEENGSYVGSLKEIEDIIVEGRTIGELKEDAAIQLIEYANDYYNEFSRYHNAPNRRTHLPYILHILSQDNIDGVKNIIHD